MAAINFTSPERVSDTPDVVSMSCPTALVEAGRIVVAQAFDDARAIATRRLTRVADTQPGSVKKRVNGTGPKERG